jgi:hypothetical protein
MRNASFAMYANYRWLTSHLAPKTNFYTAVNVIIKHLRLDATNVLKYLSQAWKKWNTRVNNFMKIVFYALRAIKRSELKVSYQKRIKSIVYLATNYILLPNATNAWKLFLKVALRIKINRFIANVSIVQIVKPRWLVNDLHRETIIHIVRNALANCLLKNVSIVLNQSRVIAFLYYIKWSKRFRLIQNMYLVI